LNRKIHILIVILFLLVHFILLLTSASQKSVTYDEIVHLTAGYSHLKLGDFRLVTEHPPLVFLWSSVPLLFQDLSFPSLYEKAWNTSDAWGLGWQFFYNCGNDHRIMLFWGRLMASVLSVGMGILIYLWSRRLFGSKGALGTLVLFSFSPTMLAHGKLVNTDMVVSFLFVSSVWGIWRVLHHFTIKSVILSALSLTGLFLTKFSAVLIIPIGILLVLIWLASGGETVLGKKREKVKKVPKKLILVAILLIVYVSMVFLGIWTAHGYRFSPFKAGDIKKAEFAMRFRRSEGESPWEYLLKEKTFTSRVIGWLRDKKLLPEGYLYGFFYALKTTEERSSFLNGKAGIKGWWYYFPYAFLVKTPLPLFFILGLTVISFWISSKKPEREGKKTGKQSLSVVLYKTSPLWCLFTVYWLVSLRTSLNIGHRHILPVYPILFIFAGGAWKAWETRTRSFKWILRILCVFFILCSFRIFPHYLSYFNVISGGPKKGYKHLVDSSLDWGQDLPSLKKHLEKNIHPPPHHLTYLSYFGMGNPAYYHIGARTLMNVPPRKPIPYFPLTSGTYCISATMLQCIYLLPTNRWTEDMEKAYTECREILGPYLKRETWAPRDHPFKEAWAGNFYYEVMDLFQKLRFCRLCQVLRKREPDDYIGYSILVYKVSEEEVEKAIHGAPMEMVPDPAYMRGDPRLRVRSPLGYMHFLKGMYFSKKGEKQKAIEHFKKAVETDPLSEEAKRRLKILSEKKGFQPGGNNTGSME